MLTLIVQDNAYHNDCKSVAQQSGQHLQSCLADTCIDRMRRCQQLTSLPYKQDNMPILIACCKLSLTVWLVQEGMTGALIDVQVAHATRVVHFARKLFC